jgi:hypothetical protein
MPTREDFTRPHYQGSSFEDKGLSVGFDWRYELVGDYLLQSHSYLAVLERTKGRRSRYPLPADQQQVLAVYQDFGDLSAYRTGTWWDTVGWRLFGLKAPLPVVRVQAKLNEESPSTTSAWTGVDSLVLTIPTTLTLQQAMRQVRLRLAKEELAKPVSAAIAPRYTLQSNRLRSDTLHLGAVALSFYRGTKKKPLWKIGHDLKLVPTMIFNLRKEELHPEEFSYEKATLATAARRLIRQAILIAENAARGRFFTDEKFPEAMIDTYKRKAGRPVGTARKKK